MILQYLRHRGRSLTYMMNRSGPSMLLVAPRLWLASKTRDSCRLRWPVHDQRDLNHSIELLFRPKQCSLFSKISWSTVSNALLRSRNTEPVIKPLSILSRMFSVWWARATSVERFRRKPNCSGASRLFSLRKVYSWWGEQLSQWSCLKLERL